MKKVFLLWGLSLILFAGQSCNKDNTVIRPPIDPPAGTPIPPPPPPPPPVNTAPYVEVGENLVKFPFSKVTLSSLAYDEQGDSIGFTWTKISGPESYRIETKDLPSTLISNLVNGDYAFALEAKDSMGLVGKDTISINVELKPLISNELIFKNLYWLYDEWMGMYLSIPDFIYIAEVGRPYKIYIKSDDNSDWVAVTAPCGPLDRYCYEPPSTIYTSLTIYSYGGNTSGISSVKVVFE